MRTATTILTLCVLAGMATSVGLAQPTQPAESPSILRTAPGNGEQPAATPPATQPDQAGQAAPRPADAQDVQARVVDVTGSVIARSESKGGDFQPVVKGQMLSSDTRVAVGAKAQAVLSFGDNSVVVLEQFSVMTIADVYKTQSAGDETVVTRLKLVNGSVRAGVERGRTRSDFQVSTPVATLSVRGTRPIRIFYDAGTGELWFYLGSEGMLVATLTGGGRNVVLEPGEGTDQWLTMPVLLAMFDYHVRLGDPWGQTLEDYLVEVFNSSSTGGFGGGDPQWLINVIQNAQRVNAANADSVFDGDSFYGDDAADSDGGDSFYGDAGSSP